MPKLLMVTTVAPTLRAFLLPFADHFRAQGWQVDAIAQGATQSPECVAAFDHVWDIEWSRNPLDLQNLIHAPGHLRKLVLQQQYDLVHVHTPVAAFVSRLALNPLRQGNALQVIYTAHGLHFYRGGQWLRNAVFLALEKLAGAWTDYLVLINREDEQAANRHRLLPPDRIRYMPGIGVDLNYYDPATVSVEAIERVRQEMGLSREQRLLLGVAEFTPRKRHQDILYALASLPRCDLHLALAGTGPLLGAMQRLAAKLGIADRVHFLGDRKDIPTLMRSAIATVLVSHQEGLPRSVMESLAMEVPVIGTRIRGTQDLIEPGCGLLVPVGGIQELAQAMTWLLEHPLLAQDLGKRGRECMGAFDLKQILCAYESLYTEALSASPRAVHSPLPPMTTNV